MINKKSKAIKKPYKNNMKNKQRKMFKNKKKKEEKKYEVLGNPDLLFDHFSNNNSLKDVSIPGLKYDSTVNQYYSEIKQPLKKVMKEVIELDLSSMPIRESLSAFMSGGVLSLINKFRIVILNIITDVINK